MLVFFFVVVIFVTEKNSIKKAYKIADIIKEVKSNHIGCLMIRSAILQKENTGLKFNYSKRKHSEIWSKLFKFQRKCFVEQTTNKVKRI